MKNKAGVYLCVTATALLFASMEPISKLIAGAVEPAVMTFFRFLVGGLVLLPLSIAGIRRRGLRLGVRDYAVMSLLGALVIASMLLLQYSVRECASPSLVAIIFSTNSVLTILFSVPLLGERFTPARLIAVLLCLAGVALGSLGSASGGTFAAAGFAGILLALGAALTFSLYTVLTKRFMRKAGGSVQTGISFLAGSLLMLPFLLIFGADLAPLTAAANLPVLLWLGLAVTGVGYLCFFYALDRGGATPASLVFFIKPVLTPFVSFAVALLFAGGGTTELSFTTFAALVPVTLGSLLVMLDGARTRAAKADGAVAATPGNAVSDGNTDREDKNA